LLWNAINDILKFILYTCGIFTDFTEFDETVAQLG